MCLVAAQGELDKLINAMKTHIPQDTAMRAGCSSGVRASLIAEGHTQIVEL